jgi:hypothetical protein
MKLNMPLDCKKKLGNELSYVAVRNSYCGIIQTGRNNFATFELFVKEGSHVPRGRQKR